MKTFAIAITLAATIAPDALAFTHAPARTAAPCLFAASNSEDDVANSVYQTDNNIVQPILMVNEEEEDSIVRPSVTRDLAIEKLSVNEEKHFDNLPLGVKMTGAEKLHADGFNGKGVRVAVIDSGIDASHPGLHGQVKQQLWYRHGMPLSQDDHGTHVAGTIHMMAPEAEIYDYRVFGSEGTRVDKAVAKSIIQAVEDDCDVINMPFGGQLASYLIESAIRYAHENGVLMIVAAGNEGEGDGTPLTNERRSFPSMRPEVVSIAAVSKSDGLPVASFSDSNAQVDSEYAGIGVNVHSFMPGGGFKQMSGTSMATPHVSGLIAALLTKGGRFRNHITDDASLRKVLNANFAKDIGVKAPTKTGIGFLTYLNENEIKRLWKDTSFFEGQIFRP